MIVNGVFLQIIRPSDGTQIRYDDLDGEEMIILRNHKFLCYSID